MSHRQTVLVCELQGPVDLCVVDALARLQLTARRCGGMLQVRVVGAELLGLLALVGLAEVLQPVRQPEAREERRGVQEVVDVDEPPA